MGCVEGNETIRYKIADVEYFEGFKKAFERVAKGRKILTSGKSEYIDTSDENIKILDSYTGDFVQVKKFIRNHDVNNWKTVKFSDGYSLVATADHPLPVVGKGRTFVEDMKVGDKVIVTPDKFRVLNSDISYKSDYFKDEYWLLGLILTDSAYSSSQIMISLGLDETDIVNGVVEACDKLGYRAHIKEQHRGVKGNYFDVSIREIPGLKYAREELAEMFDGYRKVDRQVPMQIINSARDVRLRFLAGLLDGDGYVNTSRQRASGTRQARFSLGSTSKKLAMSELNLIRSLGLDARLYRNYYNSSNSKVRFLIEFEISDDVLKYMHSNKKVLTDELADNRCNYSNVNQVQVVSIENGCADNEDSDYSYDVETVTDRFDVSGIQSHNCRTRVFTNVRNNGINGSVGRGNLSFTSINLPRLGLLAGRGNIDKFFELLDERMELVHRQLKERFEIQCLRHPRNYPFLMGQGIWKGSEDLGPDDDIRDALQNGTLTVGFIGLAETLVALTGKHHGESEESQELGLKIIGHMRELTDKWTQEEKMNYSVIGTPAEGLSGRFVKIDAKRFGKIPDITDREYYTNSSHVPVYYPISAFKKIQIEAPYHALENGGHICYIEMDGDPAKNVKAFEKVVQYAYDHDIGYFAVNHPVDRDSVCGYVGIIGDVCPRCGRRDGEPMTEEMWEKLHNKYAYTPNASSCGYCGDPNEERDRQKNLNTLDNE